MSEFEDLKPTDPLPALHEGVLDEATQGQYFTDLAALATLRGAFCKTPGAAFGEERAVPLDEAVARWKSGEARALQLRYRYADVEWVDTLMRTPHGARLVRMAAPAMPEARER